MTNIVYFNNCWFTNVGEAFIDIGSYQYIKQIFGNNIHISTITDMTEWYIDKNKNWRSLYSKALKIFNNDAFGKKYVSKAVNMFELYDADYYVLSGMFGCKAFLETKASRELLRLSKEGKKVLFLGFGGLKYNSDEINSIRDYLKELQPLLVVTRDKQTYENYKNITNCISGIDCGFWICDTFRPQLKVNKEYDLVTFNRTSEPTQFSNSDRYIIRPKHFQYEFCVKNLKENVFISDSPYDYITLYANANNVYTDLVHATVISLQYGTPVQFFPVDGRANLFDSLVGISKTSDGYLHLDINKLEKQKRELIHEIRNSINNE